MVFKSIEKAKKYLEEKLSLYEREQARRRNSDDPLIKTCTVNDNKEKDLFFFQYSILKRPLNAITEQLNDENAELTKKQHDQIKRLIIDYANNIYKSDKYYTLKNSIEHFEDQSDRISNRTKNNFAAMQQFSTDIYNIMDEKYEELMQRITRSASKRESESQNTDIHSKSMRFTGSTPASTTEINLPTK